MRCQKKEKGSKNVNLTIQAGQSKVYLQDLLKNEPLPSAIDANINHTVVGGFFLYRLSVVQAKLTKYFDMCRLYLRGFQTWL